jgi:hypothetical protein
VSFHLVINPMLTRRRMLPLMATLLIDPAASRVAGEAYPARGHSLSAPGIIVFDGHMLRHRIVLANPETNLRLFSATAVASPSEMSRFDTVLRSRPYLDMWMFWGPRSLFLARDSASLARLEPTAADQYGRFYLGKDTLPPVLEFRGPRGKITSRRLLQHEGIATLRAAGVPTAYRSGAAPAGFVTDRATFLKSTVTESGSQVATSLVEIHAATTRQTVITTENTMGMMKR